MQILYHVILCNGLECLQILVSMCVFYNQSPKDTNDYTHYSWILPNLSGLIRGGKGDLRSQDILVVVALPESSLKLVSLAVGLPEFQVKRKAVLGQPLGLIRGTSTLTLIVPNLYPSNYFYALKNRLSFAEKIKKIKYTSLTGHILKIKPPDGRVVPHRT